MKQQVIVIHGGNSFRSYKDYLSHLRNKKTNLEYFLSKKDWKSGLPQKLGKKFEVLAPVMPNKQNARYNEWEIWFERMRPFLRKGVILVGHSQGAIFLVKYLSLKKFPKNIQSLFLVASPFGKFMDVINFKIHGNLKKIRKQCKNIHIFHSKDDKVVPVGEAYEYQKTWPDAKMHIFTDRGHFNQENFPEIVREIKKIK